MPKKVRGHRDAVRSDLHRLERGGEVVAPQILKINNHFCDVNVNADTIFVLSKKISSKTFHVQHDNFTSARAPIIL